MENLEFIVTQEYAGDRLDKALVKLCPDFSRTRLQSFVDNGYVLVNDMETKSSSKVKLDDVITGEWPEDVELEVLPEEMDLDILYEDHDVVVVNKPKGMVVHPGAGNPTHTLVNGLLAHCKDLSGINGVLRPGIVHRIDKDTSGCLVVAKNDIAHQSLSKQLADKTMNRTYLALVHGVMDHEYGSIDAPIGRDKSDRQKMAVTQTNSKEAITRFTVLERFDGFTLLECKLETGRTHQIRVHMQYIGYPIMGDPKYSLKNTPDTQGQCLHASEIRFIHPTTNQEMHFNAPLPPVYADVLEELRQRRT
jgi:23S rRNA pseudouridine1911/1915/1917 synthase